MTITLPAPSPDPETQRQLEEARGQVAELITAGPLYSSLTLKARSDGQGQPLVLELIPDGIERECEVCGSSGHRTRWDRDDIVAAFDLPGSPVMFSYRCRNCGAARLYVTLAVSCPTRSLPGRPVAVAIEKVGQSPRMELKAPKRLEQSLGGHAGLYRKAITCRHQGYGIGAVAYLRRIVEETTDTLLDLVRDVLASEPGREAEITRLEEAKRGKVFDEKVKAAGEALPAHLRPGGVNPFGTLHDLLSSGIHRLSEEEALMIADATIASLEYLFTQLELHVRERKTFVERMKELEKLRQRTSG